MLRIERNEKMTPDNSEGTRLRIVAVFVLQLLMLFIFGPAAVAAPGKVQRGEMAGYLLVPNEKVPETFDAGYSMYVAAWPLLKEYPGNRFQSGLFGTWMFPKKDTNSPVKFYSDVEGGLGWWRDTQYATETPKFIMGGVAPDFKEWANGPGAGKGRDWKQPKGKYGIAQLSPWVLWPPDGLNLKQGTCGELFGYGYLPLPLAKAKKVTAGKNISTGDQCWTLFLNTKNFKGPVTFFLPYFWSKAAVEDPRFEGLLLDSRPTNPNRALQMETQHIPSAQAAAANGELYARVAITQFPNGADGSSLLVHRITSYNKRALWDAVKAWFEGGPPASGAVNMQGAVFHEIPGRGGATWRIYADGDPKEKRMPVAWSSFATPMAVDKHTFGYRWNTAMVKKADSANLFALPEYYRLVTNKNNKAEWVPVKKEDVPAELGLEQIRFGRPSGRSFDPYVTPEEPDSCWKKPGPVAGPFKAYPGDGSVVTYYWYKFCDQPALLNADMTDKERLEMQALVEKLHRNWTKDRDYLPPPAVGRLAELDPALIVTPPKGLEAGYVPIVTRQEAKTK